ncbi:uncharacterized protein LOC133191734 [Saccostrea echinata]|uniref:uncharacterized protein LOC133191734 n=1 Tax=Saccostrea echinata TaxID=191078 RepID=UPI002A8043BF|nr:uncharacterized protein LOC133191734 [Saccostrea echinata]
MDRTFKEILHRPPPTQEPEADLNIFIEPPQIPEIVSPQFYNQIFHDIWKSNFISEEWHHGVIIRIPKKGNLNDCSNWRGKTLLSIPSKTMTKIITGGSSTTFIGTVWKIVRSYGIPQHLTNSIKSFYVNIRCRVGNRTIEYAVKQESVKAVYLSSTLFIIAIDWVMKNTTSHIPRGIRWDTFTRLEDL